MMIMTAKVNMKKILLFLAGTAVVILALILLLGGGKDPAAATAAPAASNNDSRVKFLQDFGWEVSASPTQSGQVKIPEESSDVFTRYNALQQSQGYDLSAYAGKKVMRYVYQINNFPGAKEPVYATLLVYKNKIIGGDVTDTSAKGQIRCFKMPTAAELPQPSTQPTTLPTEPADSGTGVPQQTVITP